MKLTNSRRSEVILLLVGLILLVLVFGCGEAKEEAQWPKSRSIAGRKQGLSHISGLLVDGKFAFVAIGGTIADQNDGTNGIRRIALDTGEVTVVDASNNLTQVESGGMASDEKFIYWNAGGSIWRCAKDGGRPERVVSENVGIGIDMAVGKGRIFWVNHGYYVAGASAPPRPIYSVSNMGGHSEIFADNQEIPHDIVADDKFVYWHTSAALMKQLLTGGEPVAIVKIDPGAGLGGLSQDKDSLYFGFRRKGESAWALTRIEKNGGEPITLVERYAIESSLSDNKNIYFFRDNEWSAYSLCRIAKTGGDVTVLDSGYAGGALAAEGDSIYFAGLDDLWSIAK